MPNNINTSGLAFDATAWHKRLITADRYKDRSSVSGRRIDEEAASDRARVIYSSAFRRLQHKTQVFTLSKDAAVRSRLTHSLEVASVGRWIAQTIVDDSLVGLDRHYSSALISLVETGCLAHDIGNPPFGHFGEASIRKWFTAKWESLAGARANVQLTSLMEDLFQFDGNPQGIRILTRLQGLTQKDREDFGMDLTYSQVLTALKYPRGPLDSKALWKKKPGFFETERVRINEAWSKLGFKVQQRFPLAYLVEAADDISYCIGDMEDGIDQGIFTPLQFFEGIDDWLKKPNPEIQLDALRAEAQRCRTEMATPRNLESEKERQSERERDKDCFATFKAAFSRTMIKEAARCYGDGGAEDIQRGERPELLGGTDANDLLQTLKTIASRFLYPADKVQTPFLAGLKVIYGILEEYGEFLRLTKDQFTMIRVAWRSADRRDISENHLETLLPLLDRLPSHYLDVYDDAVKSSIRSVPCNDETWEWFCRAHLIVDYLSGMTDDFAYRTYQVISGAQLE